MTTPRKGECHSKAEPAGAREIVAENGDGRVKPGHNVEGGTLAYELRRSAVQVPEQAPPVQ
jgi:hypothetical protein